MARITVIYDQNSIYFFPIWMPFVSPLVLTALVRTCNIMLDISSENVSRSVVSDSVIPWTVACQAALSMELILQARMPFPSPGDLPNPGGRNVFSPFPIQGEKFIFSPLHMI